MRLLRGGTNWSDIFLVAAGAFIARCLYWALVTPSWIPNSDADQYVLLARALADGDGYSLDLSPARDARDRVSSAALSTDPPSSRLRDARTLGSAADQRPARYRYGRARLRDSAKDRRAHRRSRGRRGCRDLSAAARERHGHVERASVVAPPACGCSARRRSTLGLGRRCVRSVDAHTNRTRTSSSQPSRSSRSSRLVGGPRLVSS